MHNRLTLIKELPYRNKDNRKIGLFRCECGKEKEIRIDRVNRNVIVSCGCYRNEQTSKATKTHGLKKHPIYTAWINMKKRCYNEKCDDYKNYGGRGVSVCEEWRTEFMPFYNWCVDNGWRKGLEVDKDIKGTGLLYSPDMCLLVTKKENANKRRNNHVVEFEGVKYNQIQLVRKFNIPQTRLSERLRKGLSVEDALFKPPKKKREKPTIKYAFGFIN